MVEIGQINKMVISRVSDGGSFLKLSDEIDEVFMPNNLGPLSPVVGQAVDAFVYVDTAGKLVATDQTPSAVVGEYALMRAIEVQEFGAFFDWGIDKDLLVPGNQQKMRVRKFEDHIVRVCIEEETDRVFGSTKLGKYISESNFDITKGDEVEIVVAHKSELGYRVIINKKFIGMIYDSEIFQDIQVGGKYSANVKKIRDDGLVDISLQPLGVKNMLDSKEVILEFLKDQGGSSHLNDKSSPEDIKRSLNMSKKTFKAAIGMLYKDKKIAISKSGIELLKV
ncbi:CvfB family protein [Halobacteriovorax marinus]|nr:S1-like domain-containing RNA-binding protein [Halobacteriovorax marinus]